jgi:hypothetical protein
LEAICILLKTHFGFRYPNGYPVGDNLRESNQEAPPTLVYDTETAALTIGSRLPDGYLGDSGAPTVVGDERLYVLTDLYDDELRQRSFSLCALSRTPTASPWLGSSETIMTCSWNDDDDGALGP